MSAPVRELSSKGSPRSYLTYAAAALVSFGWLYVAPYYPAINNPNENVRFYMTAAMVEEGRYAIDSFRQRWGWVNDASMFDGQYYSVKAPLTSLLGVPGYAAYYALSGGKVDRDVALYVCRLTGIVLPNAVFAWVFALWLRRRSRYPGLADAAIVSAFLGSAFYGYTLLFVSHATAASAAFGAFMLLLGAQEGRSSHARAFAAGLLAACVTALEYHGLVASVVLSVYAIATYRRLKPLAFFGLGGLIPTAAVMHFQWAAYGNPFSPGHRHLETDGLRATHSEGLYGATHFHTDAAFSLLWDPGSGLFVLTPLLLLGMVGFIVLIRRRVSRAAALTAATITVLTYVAICFMNNWRAGWTIGPRYLTLVVPFLAWAALPVLEWLADRSVSMAHAIAVGATATGIVLAGIPSAYYPHLPPEITRPIPQLLFVLIEHDFAPHNALNLLGVYGTASMIPLFVALAIAGLLPLIPLRHRNRRERGFAFLGAAGVAACMLLLTARPEATAPEVKRAVAFITDRWAPAGYDRAAVMESELAQSTAKSPDRFRHLADVYFAEGRDDRGRRAITRGRRAALEEKIKR